ncbi:MAG: right-handed parallel beta-helix repeat-containing protein [Phycisphaerales bacterium]|nr:MAG: right-handed parallel beta-helix repeat-containing protein [Phycisphaerales bacterium]
MKLADVKLILICLLWLVLVHSSTWAMTIQLGSGASEFIAPGDTWAFFRGVEPPSVPADAWKDTDFNDSHWETGDSGFGYGDGDDATALDDMRGEYVTVYIRTEFSVSSLSGDEVVQLVIDYDDGFIAYLNGHEVARRHMPDGPANHETRASSHEAGTPETIALGVAGDLLNEGSNLLAIEGHNTSAGSSDFSLIPALRTASDTVRNGDKYIVQTQTLRLRGTTDAPEAVSVTIDGTLADFDLADGTWSGDVSLTAGLNTINAEALDAEAHPVDSGSIDIVYVSPANLTAGELTEDTTWSGAVILEDDVIVPAGIVLTIEPSTFVLANDTVALTVYGQLLADGTKAEPIRFTHYGDGTRWKQIMFIQAEDSRLEHCFIEYADCEGDHKDYYDNDCDPETPLPSRTYFQAVVALACHVDIEGCVFQNLPDDGSGGEGDAIAIISDDPDHPGDATAKISDCRFLSIGQGVHTRYSYVLVENCFFTDHHGDNDDVDLYGESTPPPLIRNNLFLNPDHDDMINPTRCSAVIIGNVIAGCDDHGVVLRDKCSPVLINNLIYDCSSAGIAVQNQCDAILVNNTIANCGRGIRFFDHTGRWGPPYCLLPGSGKATVINCIIWDCPTSMLLTDSPYEGDRGSHVTVAYSNIEGGQSSMSVSAASTVTWAEGNINADPLFADPSNGDYHLKSQAGRWDPTARSWVADDVTSPCIDTGDPEEDWTSELWPHGKRINMGVYGGTPQASMSLSNLGNKADSDNDGNVDARDLLMLAEAWLLQDVLLAEDIDRSGSVDATDLAVLATQWLHAETP